MADGLRLASSAEHGLRTGFWHIAGLLSPAECVDLADLARWWCAEAPLARPTMRDGVPMRVRVSSVGDVGWWADRGRYCYVDRHPTTRAPWPAMPIGLRLLGERALRAARAFGSDVDAAAIAEIFDTCLLNYYGPGDSLGWHQDLTEEDRRTPIVGISLGAPATFEVILGPDDEEVSMVLESGDAVVMAGQSRMARHRIAGLVEAGLFSGRSPLAGGGRLSFTFRRARGAA